MTTTTERHARHQEFGSLYHPHRPMTTTTERHARPLMPESLYPPPAP